MQDVKGRAEKAKIEKDEKERKRQDRIRKEKESERRLRLAFRVSEILFTFMHASFLIPLRRNATLSFC